MHASTFCTPLVAGGRVVGYDHSTRRLALLLFGRVPRKFGEHESHAPVRSDRERRRGARVTGRPPAHRVRAARSRGSLSY